MKTQPNPSSCPGREAPNLPQTAAALPDELQALIEKAHKESHRFLRIDQVADRASLGHSTVWRDVKRGTFVPPVRISRRSVGWIESEVEAILAAKVLCTRMSLELDLTQFIRALVKRPE